MAYIANITYELKTTEVNGLKIPFKRFEGIDYNFFTFMPDNIEEHMQDIKDLEVRDDDVLLCTYPRSGSNWTHEIVHMLLSGKAEYNPELPEYFDMIPKHKLITMPSPRYFMTHFPFRYIPQQFSKKGRIICVLRNPKDVAVSYHHLLRRVNWAEYDGNIGNFLKLFYSGNLPAGSWFDYILDWERVIEQNAVQNMLVIYYEDMRKDLLSQVNEIAEFLGIPSDEDLFARIANKCEFTNLNHEKTTNVQPIFSKLSKDGKSNYLYRKGEAGDWKNCFTVSQNEEFDKIYNERMKSSKLSFRFQ